MASNRWRTPSMNDIRVPTRTRMSIGVARCPTSTINCDFARTVSVNPALHSSCICRDRSKLCSVVVDHQVRGRCHLEGPYVECHGASAIGIHHVRSLLVTLTMLPFALKVPVASVLPLPSNVWLHHEPGCPLWKSRISGHTVYPGT